MKPRLMILLLLVATAFVALPGGPLRAAPSAQDKVRARKLLRIAKRFIRQKQHPRAIEAFKQAYRYWPRKELQFNIALVYLELGAKIKAYEHLSIYWNLSSAAERSRLPVPLLRLRNEYGTLRIRASDPGMAIHVGGSPRGKGSAEVVVEPGTHEVEIQVDGQVVQRKALRVTGGAVVVWEAEAPRPRGVVTGGGTTPTPTPGASSSSRKTLHWAWFVGAAGLAVAAGIVVAGTGARTLQLGDDYQADQTRELQKEGRTYKAVTNVMIGVSAAAAITAAVLAIFTRWSSAERPAAVTVLPGVAPGGGSVTLQFAY